MGEDKDAAPKDVSFFKILTSVVSQLRPGQDITRIRLPSNLCYPFTLLQFIPMKRMRGMEALKGYADLETPLDRMLCVLKWYLACLTEDEYGKKPLNPVIGESYLCHSDGTIFVSEQVSHHPPISAFYFENQELKFKFEGHLELQAKFHANSVAAVTLGVSKVTVHDDVYTFTRFLPTLNCRNLLIGSSRNEYGGDVVLSCGDLTSKLTFKLQGKVFGHPHVVKGEVVEAGVKKPLATISGHWHSVVNVSFPDGAERDLPFLNGEVLYDFESVPSPELTEVRTEEQEDRASGQVWADVVEPISNKNWEEANERKAEVENNQRSLMEAMMEDGEEMELKFFSRDEEEDLWVVNDDIVEHMRSVMGAAAAPSEAESEAASEDDGKKKKKKKKKKSKDKAEADE